MNWTVILENGDTMPFNYKAAAENFAIYRAIYEAKGRHMHIETDEDERTITITVTAPK